MIDIFEQTDSTRSVVNDFLSENYANEAFHTQTKNPIVYCALAFKQTAGTGRRGNAWMTTPNSSLMLTVLTKIPKSLSESLSVFGFITALCALDIVREEMKQNSPENYLIKWPNDIIKIVHNYKGDEVFKVAGVITELTKEDDNFLYLSVSIGLNIFQTESDFNFATNIKPSSLLIDCKKNNRNFEKYCNKNQVEKQEIITSLANNFLNLIEERFSCFINARDHKEAKRRLHRIIESNLLKNRIISMHLPNNERINGEIIGLNQDFSLQLKEIDTDVLHCIKAGDMIISKLY